MRFHIRHVTLYRYDRPVALGPHLFRLRPRAGLRVGEGLRLDDFRLFTHPRAATARSLVDDEGNKVEELRFEGTTQEFRVVMECEGETLATPAPAALGASGSGPVPLAPDYTGMVGAAFAPDRLAAWLRRPEGEASVAAFSDAVAAETRAGGATAFLAALAERLHARLRDVPRLTGAPHSPEASLRAGQGSCRDFAVLFVSCCRHQGIAARFVSGYLPAPPGEAQHMHAWAEALLPGVGWVPYDPARGGLAGPEYIPVAAAAEAYGAAPLEGAFTPQGGPARSEMTVEVVVETGDFR